MWGEKWGTMIWGGGSDAVAVQIPFGPWTLLLLGFILGVCAVYANRSRMARVVPFVMVLLVPVVSVIAVNLPHVFTDGTVADANQVNENFDYLEQFDQDILGLIQPIDEDVAALIDIVSNLQVNYGACTWSQCLDSPRNFTCPIGEVLVGIHMPEFGGDEGGCNSNPGTGSDDVRFRCCKMNVSAP